jgi:uncharacterized membrane protein YhhN
VVVSVPYLLVGGIHLVALAIGAEPLASITKPLLMPLLLAAFLFALPRIRGELALLGSLGILLSWAGDVTVASPGDLGFLVGLGFFLLAHVAYIFLFLRRLRMRRLRPVALLYLAWWAALVVVLAPHLGPLLVPVAVYGLVLGTMAAIGLSCNRWIAIGGALFVVSDSLLGLDRFLPGFDFAQLSTVIMLSYLAAQAFIVAGAVRTAWSGPGTARSAGDR